MRITTPGLQQCAPARAPLQVPPVGGPWIVARRAPLIVLPARLSQPRSAAPRAESPRAPVAGQLAGSCAHLARGPDALLPDAVSQSWDFPAEERARVANVQPTECRNACGDAKGLQARLVSLVLSGVTPSRSLRPRFVMLGRSAQLSCSSRGKGNTNEQVIASISMARPQSGMIHRPRPSSPRGGFHAMRVQARSTTMHLMDMPGNRAPYPQSSRNDPSKVPAWPA